LIELSLVLNLTIPNNFKEYGKLIADELKKAT